MKIKTIALAAVAALSIGAAGLSGPANAASVNPGAVIKADAIAVKDSNVQTVRHFVYPGNRRCSYTYRRIVSRYAVRRGLFARGFYRIRSIRLVRNRVFAGYPGYRHVGNRRRCRVYYVSIAKRGYRWYRVRSSAYTGRVLFARPLYNRYY